MGWIVNTYSMFKVDIFSNNRNITKCQFLHHHDDDAKATAIPENSRAKNGPRSSKCVG